MSASTTYAFEGDRVFAIRQGKVVDSDTDVGALESRIAEDENPGIREIREQQNAPGEPAQPKDVHEHVDDKIQHAIEEAKALEQADDANRRHTHVITPNGLKGKILGGGLYSDEISVRFDNGQTATFAVTAGTQFYTPGPEVPSNPVVALRERLSRIVEPDAGSLRIRLAELTDIRNDAQELFNTGVPYEDELSLDQIAQEAVGETQQVRDALQHLEEQEAQQYQGHPYDLEAVEQGGPTRGNDSRWLDLVTQEMEDEAAQQDYDALLRDEPGQFVTELDDGVVEDPNLTRDMALSHIQAKTAGLSGESVERFHSAFVSRTEQARLQELQWRENAQRQPKRASAEPDTDFPDDALFI